MPTHDDLDTVLQKIRELAQRATREADTPPAVGTILEEIASLARARVDGTREGSDVPQTENQTL